MSDSQDCIKNNGLEPKNYYEYFFDTLKKTNIMLDNCKVYMTHDINIAVSFLSELLSSKIPHTANLCFQAFLTPIHSVESDNDSYLNLNFTDKIVKFKFKSMVIMMPPNHNLSPIVFLEAENDANITNEEKEHTELYKDKKYIKIYQSKATLEYSFEPFSDDNYKTIYKYISDKLFCYINYNKLDYEFITKLAPNWSNMTANEFVSEYERC